MVRKSCLFSPMYILILLFVDGFIEICLILWVKIQCWASLVALWLRICLPMQGTQVRALVWEDPTCRGATKPVRHNY